MNVSKTAQNQKLKVSVVCEAIMDPEGEEHLKKLNPETFEDIKVELNPI